MLNRCWTLARTPLEGWPTVQDFKMVQTAIPEVHIILRTSDFCALQLIFVVLLLQ